MKSMLAIVSLVAITALAVSPADAKTRHHRVSCKQIKDAIAAGKSEEDVAKDLKVSATTVKHCTAQTTAKAATPKHK